MSKRLDVIYENGVFRPLEPVQLEEHQRATVTIPEPDSPISIETCFDIAERIGVIGAIDNLPADLSTNPDHFEGFGQNE